MPCRPGRDAALCSALKLSEPEEPEEEPEEPEEEPAPSKPEEEARGGVGSAD